MNTLRPVRRYVQRDLEDQINEELHNVNNKSKISNLETNLKTKSMTTEATAAPKVKPEIKISDVIGLLDKGATRLAKFDKGDGSVQAHYGLSVGQVKELFNHPKLKGKKTKSVSLKVIDDAPEVKVTEIKAKTPKAAKPVAAGTDAALFS